MALSLRRDPAETPVEALLFAERFADLDALAADLDAEFGRDGWRRADGADAARLLRERGGAGAFAIFAVSSDAADAVEATAKLIRQARDAGLPVLLVTGDLSLTHLSSRVAEA